MPKISFLIATKNRADLINETLDSLINQTEKDWEAIIVDDHGNDDTEEMINKYQDPRFRYFYLKDAHGKGASCARNFACLQAESSIVAILDSDDIAYPNRSSETIKSFEEDSDLEVFYSSFDIWKEKTGEVYERNKPPVYDYSIDIMKKFNYIPHCTLALRREVLLSNPYNSFFKIAEDYELTSRLAINGKKFFKSNQKLTKYRFGIQNISFGTDKIERVKLYDKLVRMIRGWIPFESDILTKIEKLESILK